MSGPNTTTVVGICGSRRAGSVTRVAVRRALEAAATAGVETDWIDTGEITLPAYNPDTPDAGAAESIRATVRAADGVLLGTPMYHGSYSSATKSVLDICGFDEFEDTIVGLLAVSGGAFPRPALEHLRSVCRALRAWVLPLQVGIPNASEQVQDGRLTDEDLATRVSDLGEALAVHADTGRFRVTTA